MYISPFHQKCHLRPSGSHPSIYFYALSQNAILHNLHVQFTSVNTAQEPAEEQFCHVQYVLRIKMFELMYRICLWEFFVSNFAKLIL